MDAELFETLEKRVERLIQSYTALKRENEVLRGENQRLLQDRQGFKERIDAIIGKLEGI